MSNETVRFALFAEVFAALAHPKRLEIIHHLGEGQRNAGELTELTGMSKANVSQHLNILKARGLVHCDKCGTFCNYRLTSPKVLETCKMEHVRSDYARDKRSRDSAWRLQSTQISGL